MVLSVKRGNESGSVTNSQGTSDDGGLWDEDRTGKDREAKKATAGTEGVSICVCVCER